MHSETLPRFQLHVHVEVLVNLTRNQVIRQNLWHIPYYHQEHRWQASVHMHVYIHVAPEVVRRRDRIKYYGCHSPREEELRCPDQHRCKSLAEERCGETA